MGTHTKCRCWPRLDDSHERSRAHHLKKLAALNGACGLAGASKLAEPQRALARLDRREHELRVMRNEQGFLRLEAL